MLRLRGEGVTIWRPTTTYDSAYDPVDTWTPEHVDNVLWGRPTTEQADATMRAFGVDVAYVLGIPKGYTESLRGCRVTRDRDLVVRIIGSDVYVQPNRLSVDGDNAIVRAEYVIERGNMQFADEWLYAYAIAGDPAPLPPEICPTPWNREAHVGWVDG